MRSDGQETGSESASRPALVLIHGWGGTAAQWDAVLPGLSAIYDCHAVNLPVNGVQYSGIVGMGAALGAWLQETGLRDALLLGHSMGGPVAVETALAAPDRVKGILGLDTLADREFFGGSSADEIARRRAAFAGDVPTNTRAMVDAICAPTTPALLRRTIADAILANPADDLLAARDAMFAWRIADRLPQLRCALRLCNSAAVMRAHLSAPIDALSSVPHRSYGDGHFPQLEQPDTILPVLIAELSALRHVSGI